MAVDHGLVRRPWDWHCTRLLRMSGTGQPHFAPRMRNRVCDSNWWVGFITIDKLIDADNVTLVKAYQFFWRNFQCLQIMAVSCYRVTLGHHPRCIYKNSGNCIKCTYGTKWRWLQWRTKNIVVSILLTSAPLIESVGILCSWIILQLTKIVRQKRMITWMTNRRCKCRKGCKNPMWIMGK